MGKRFILDTNTFLSAVLLPQSITRQAVDKAMEQGELLVSEATILEIMEVITRPKFDRYIPEVQRRMVLSLLLRRARFVIVTITITDCRDANDNKFLELAVAGAADVLLTGDNDLLELHPYGTTAIITPGEFLRSPMV